MQVAVVVDLDALAREHDSGTGRLLDDRGTLKAVAGSELVTIPDRSTVRAARIEIHVAMTLQGLTQSLRRGGEPLQRWPVDVAESDESIADKLHLVPQPVGVFLLVVLVKTFDDPRQCFLVDLTGR